MLQAVEDLGKSACSMPFRSRIEYDADRHGQKFVVQDPSSVEQKKAGQYIGISAAT